LLANQTATYNDLENAAMMLNLGKKISCNYLKIWLSYINVTTDCTGHNFEASLSLIMSGSSRPGANVLFESVSNLANREMMVLADIWPLPLKMEHRGV